MSLDEYNREWSNQNMAHIDSLVSRARLTKRIVPVLGKNILLLDLANGPPVNRKRLEGYAAQHIAALRRFGDANRCFDIARSAHRAGRASGTMHTDSGTSRRLTLYGNHCINFDLQDDGTAIGVDLTASYNADRQQGRFDILALRSANLSELQLRVGELFGGEWHIDK